MSETNQYITDALYRMIGNDSDLYYGSRHTCQGGYVNGYYESASHWTRTTQGATAPYHHSAAKTWAADSLKEYIEEVKFEEEGDRSGEFVTRTLAAAALDLVDWRDLCRRILQSVAEGTDGYYQMSEREQSETTLAVCRAYVAEQEGESE